MNVASVLNGLTEPIVIKRASGSYVDGSWVAGADTDINADACVQPTRGKDLEKLPEGQRASVIYTIYLENEVFTARQSSAQTSDRIEWRGAVYQIEHVEPWFICASYSKAYMRRVGD